MMDLKKGFAEKLHNARLMRGLSMQQLCDMMGNIITKQTLSKYENGVMLPKSDIVIALCDAMEINPDYLFCYKTSSPRNIRYSKLQGLSKKEEMAIASIIENTIERTGEIEEICGIDHSFNSVLAEHQVKTLFDVLQGASMLRQAWGMGITAITNVMNLLESKGVIIANIDASDAFTSLHAILNDSIPVIAINSNLNAESFRFAALKELAHAILSFDKSIDNKKKDHFCCVFANETLLPHDVFFSVVGRKRNGIALMELKYLQNEYGISVDALMAKAKYLGVISSNHYSDYCKNLGSVSFTKKSGLDSIAEEKVTKFESMVYRALASGIITQSKAAALLNKNTVDIVRNSVIV
jgi:Zn-dependent peptidase ImmA (M78 family)/transcriptional regulator with XRE-family HTH domain